MQNSGAYYLIFFKKHLTKKFVCDIIDMLLREQHLRRGVAQIGSALPWGGRGRGFKSRHSDQQPYHKCDRVVF